MTFQSSALTMVDLSVDGRVQPLEEFPRLEQGNHLRWGFDPSTGFASHGYYLFRREHIGPKLDSHQLSDHLSGVATGSQSLPLDVSSPDGLIRFSGPAAVRTFDDFELAGGRSFVQGSDSIVEFDLPDDPLLLSFPSPAFEVTVVLDVQRSIHVTAFAHGSEDDRIPVDSGRIKQPGSVTLSFDAIDGMELSGDGTLIDVHYKLVIDQYNKGWKPVPDTDQPFTLPIEHPYYPGTGGGAEDLEDARHLAADRIRYGDPSLYVDPGSTVQSLQVTVSNGSSIVTTTGTWDHSVVGHVLRVIGDDTAYVVSERLSNDRVALSRPYEGAGQTATAEVSEDEFATLHDSLASLVDEGTTAGGMAGRIEPVSVDSDRAFYWPGTRRVLGSSSTNWTSELEGLQFYPALSSDGTISATQGVSAVQRDSGSVPDPRWGQWIVGGSLRISGQRTGYEVVGVDGARLLLDRPYAGPDLGGANFTIVGETSYEIEEVLAPDELRLSSPYRGQYRSPEYVIAPVFGADVRDGPRFAVQHPLDSVLVSTLSPAFAQVLGLYCIDETADVDQSYDYLIVADRSGRVARYYEPSDSFDPLNAELFGPWGSLEDVDGYITFDVHPDRRQKLTPPRELAGYELPQRPPTREHPYRNAAGIGWRAETSPRGRVLPDEAVYYHLWRHDYGEDEPDEDPLDPDAYRLVTSTPQRPADRNPFMIVTGERDIPLGWPNDPIHTVDPGRPDGWYGYRVNGVDLFGRASELSDAATWYDLDGTTERHPVAVELRDDTPPPPPRGVAAERFPAASVPDAGNGEMTVRWLWPEAFARQAPDTTEFRLHYHPGSLADQTGSITAVANSSSGVYTVRTDIEPVDLSGVLPLGDGYAGATLHAAGRSFEVIDSALVSGGSTLEVTVGDRRTSPPPTLQTRDGPIDLAQTDTRPYVVRQSTVSGLDSPPSAGSACTITIPPTYRKGTVIVTDGETEVVGLDTDWSKALEGRPFTTPEGGLYAVSAVDDTTHLRLDQPYDIPNEDTASHGTSYAIGHPLSRDPADPSVWDRPPLPNDWEAAWETVPLSAGTVVDPSTIPVGDRQFPAEDEPYRLYEVKVPVPAESDPATDPFVPTGERPVVYANVGVSAIDDDDNESPVSTAQIARAKTDPPSEPEPPTYTNEIDWATPPDYDGQAHYTVRWRHPPEVCRTHVYRAMDKTLFEHDWRRRRAGASQDVSAIEADKPLFPAFRRDDDTRRGQIVDALDGLHTSVSGEPDFETVLGEYTALDPDVKQVLAALPENRPAYQQVTLKPLAVNDEEAQNRVGPDLEPGESYPTGARWCAYVDSFDGRSRRQYFYRTGTIDGAGNPSERWSDPTQPVQAIDTTPPRSPSPRRVTGGDREVMLAWTPNPEPDLSSYVVYRTVDERDSGDVRSMEVVHTEPAGEVQEVTWTDSDPPVLTNVHYRLVAVDDAGNHSPPSTVLVGRAVDTAPPTPPVPSVSWATDTAGTSIVEITWTSDHEVLLQRRSDSGDHWISLTGWLPPTTAEETDKPPTDVAYEYRLKARKIDTGAVATGTGTILSPL